MRKLWLTFGVLVFWCAWPLLWIYLRGSKRTRLLIICHNEFLALRGWITPGHWNLPGGGLHSDEDPLTGLLREVKEETGIDFSKDQVAFFYSGMYHEFGFKFAYDCYVTEVSVKPEIKRQRWEIVDSSWQQIKNPGVQVGQDVRDILQKWLGKE